MSYFRVDFDKMQDIIERQKKISKALDQSADKLLASSIRVAGLGRSLQNKDYGGKLWNAYSEAAKRSVNVTNSRKDLARVHDIFLKYEKKVLQNAEEDITVKNGFTKAAANKAKKAAGKAEDKEKKEKQTKKKTFWDVFKETVDETGKGYKDTGKFFEYFKEYRSTAGKQQVEEFYYDLENFGVDPFFIGGIRLFEKKVGKKYESYEKVFVWVTDPTDTTKAAEGFKSYLSLIDPTGIVTKPLQEGAGFIATTNETLKKEGYYERGDQYIEDIAKEISEGDYKGTFQAVGEYIIEFPKAVYDIGISYGKKKVDDVLENVTWPTGKIWTTEDLFEKITGGDK